MEENSKKIDRKTALLSFVLRLCMAFFRDILSQKVALRRLCKFFNAIREIKQPLPLTLTECR